MQRQFKTEFQTIPRWYDCFLIVSSNVNLSDFQTDLTSLHVSLQSDVETSEVRILFSDILIELENGQITTDVRSKSTDIKNYLSLYSCHQKHTKVNMPFNPASRIVTILSDPDIQDLWLQELSINLKKKHKNLVALVKTASIKRKARCTLPKVIYPIYH